MGGRRAGRLQVPSLILPGPGPGPGLRTAGSGCGASRLADRGLPARVWAGCERTSLSIEAARVRTWSSRGRVRLGRRDLGHHHRHSDSVMAAPDSGPAGSESDASLSASADSDAVFTPSQAGMVPKFRVRGPSSAPPRRWVGRADGPGQPVFKLDSEAGVGGRET